jgi:hypothetical protein
MNDFVFRHAVSVRHCVRAGVLPWLLVAASGCSRPPAAPAAVKRTRADSASQKLYGLHAPMTHNGVTRGILRADSAFVYEEGMRLELRGVRAALEGPTGLALGALTAKEGVVTLANSRITLRGTVEITGTNGRQLQTPAVSFDLIKNRLLGDSAYSIRAAKTARPTTGTGFVADPGLTRVLSAADFLKEEAAAAQRVAKAAADSAARKARTKVPSASTAKAKSVPAGLRSK